MHELDQISNCSLPSTCPLLEKEFPISGVPLVDLAKMGTGLKMINTPAEEYASLALTGFRAIKQAYEKAGHPIRQDQWTAALNFYGLKEEEPAQK